MLRGGWFHHSTVHRSVWFAFALLLIMLATQHSRSESHAPEKSYPRHRSFPAHLSDHKDLSSPGWSNPTDSEHSMRFLHLSRETRPSKSRARLNGAFCITKSAQWHRERRKLAPHFFFMPCSGLNLSHSPRWLCLP